MEKGILEFDTEVVYSEKDIQKYVSMLATYIKSTMQVGDKPKRILYVCVMDGAVQFFHDITKNLPPGYCQYTSVNSYKNNKRTGNIRITLPPTSDVYEPIGDIYIFDDICDTGNTLKSVVKAYQNGYPFSNIHTVVLINRVRPDAIYMPNFMAINTESDTYFAGYGLDNKGMDRNLPYIYSVSNNVDSK